MLGSNHVFELEDVNGARFGRNCSIIEGYEDLKGPYIEAYGMLGAFFRHRNAEYGSLMGVLLIPGTRWT